MCRINATPAEMEEELASVYRSLGFRDEPSEAEAESIKQAAAFAFTDTCSDILKGEK